jgi:hypothetical protein
MYLGHCTYWYIYYYSVLAVRQDMTQVKVLLRTLHCDPMRIKEGASVDKRHVARQLRRAEEHGPK